MNGRTSIFRNRLIPETITTVKKIEQGKIVMKTNYRNRKGQ